MITARAIFRPRDDLGRFVDAMITPGVRASVEASCKLIEDTAKRYAPVLTGALRDSIATDINESGRTVIGTVSANVPYAGFVEFGTRHMGAQPYMRPAFDEARGAIEDLFRSNVGLGLVG